MKNTDCVIYITTKRGRIWSYLKENNGWTQTGPTGIVRRLSAEQLLSHLLPLLAAVNPGHLNVRVEQRVGPARQPMRRGQAPDSPRVRLFFHPGPAAAIEALACWPDAGVKPATEPDETAPSIKSAGTPDGPLAELEHEAPLHGEEGVYGSSL